jgi:hypothetical protein
LGRIDGERAVDHPARGADGRRIVNADGSDDSSTVQCEYRKRRLAEDASVGELLRMAKLANNFHVNSVAVGPKPGRGVGRGGNSQDRRGGTLAIELSGLPVFASAGQHTIIAASGSVADGKYGRVGSYEPGVDDDPAVNAESSRFGKRGLGGHADRK